MTRPRNQSRMNTQSFTALDEKHRLQLRHLVCVRGARGSPRGEDRHVRRVSLSPPARLELTIYVFLAVGVLFFLWARRAAPCSWWEGAGASEMPARCTGGTR